MMRGNDHDQFTLFDSLHTHEWKLWFLVTYPQQEGERLVVLREVAQPEPTPQGQVVDRWAHRITLPPLVFGPLPTPRGTQGPDDVDVTVTPRQ
jgi:hypothetical protein